MSDKKPQYTSPDSQDDEEIAEAAARLSAKWALAAQTNEVKSEKDGAGAVLPRKTTTSGPILQTLEKGRTHMVTVEVKRRRGKGSNGSNGQDK